MGLWDYGIMGLWDYGIMGLWEILFGVGQMAEAIRRQGRGNKVVF
ncbi:hypothetical protein [Gilvimarinus sp. 1_MG-2023]|nr:hypothetical protein [Gilvimarinus sp. 1_MG-2023]